MAYRKVDESSLTAVADAIRSKGGTSETLVFPSGFVSAVEAIQAGGGGLSNIERTLLTTSASNGTFDALMRENPVPITYKNGIIYIIAEGDNVQASGSVTFKAAEILIVNGEVVTLLNSYKTIRANGTVAPSSIDISTCAFANAAFGGSVSNGNLIWPSGTSYQFGAGNSIYYINIPFNLFTGSFDFTLMGE